MAQMSKMSKTELLTAIKNKEARVFARVRFGLKALKLIEQTKASMLSTIKDFDDDAVFGANVSKKGHVYIYGVTLDEAKELGEIDEQLAVD